MLDEEGVGDYREQEPLDDGRYPITAPITGVDGELIRLPGQLGRLGRPAAEGEFRLFQHS
jgi:hypothetical protein